MSLKYMGVYRLADSGKQYGYMVVTQEDAAVVKGLWNATKTYLETEGVEPTFLANHKSPSGEWNRDMYYTNFEVSSEEPPPPPRSTIGP